MGSLSGSFCARGHPAVTPGGLVGVEGLSVERTRLQRSPQQGRPPERSLVPRAPVEDVLLEEAVLGAALLERIPVERPVTPGAAGVVAPAGDAPAGQGQRVVGGEPLDVLGVEGEAPCRCADPVTRNGPPPDRRGPTRAYASGNNVASMVPWRSSSIRNFM
jgi:hypothetical protein